MAVEFELKLQIPDDALAAVRARVGTASAVSTRLQAIYFDTAERHLAAAGIALRLRKEGRRWVQTLKACAAGAPGLSRLEHEVDRGSAREPELDIALHADTEVGMALQEALHPVADARLIEQFRTDISRTHRLQRVAGGSVELALDVGVIRAGHAHCQVQELEIELKRGPNHLVTTAAEPWVRRHGLWIDTRSKAERGHRLRAAASGTPVAAAAPTGTDHTDLISPLLGPLLANASELAAGTGGDEHIHQLRVSLRRLRSVARLGERWMQPWPEDVTAAVVALFRDLGAQRDRQVVDAAYARHLATAGCPIDHLPLPAEGSALDAVGQLRSVAVTLAWLWLLRAASLPPRVDSSEGLILQVGNRLERWAAEIQLSAERFAHLDEPARHGLRKHIKRLRYALDSCALWRTGLQGGLSQPRKEYVAALTSAQAELGELCDLLTARDLWRDAVSTDARAWFAVGWFSGEIQRQEPAVRKALRRLCRVERRWR